MKLLIGSVAAITCLLLTACAPQTEAECLLEVSKSAKSDKGAVIGMQACKEKFPDQSNSLELEKQSKTAVGSVNPGDVVDGYVFLGGDLGDKDSWMKSAATVTQEVLIQKEHPNWLDTINTPDFAAWMNSQPAEIKALADSDKARDAIKMLNLFEQSKMQIATTQ